MIRYEWVPTHDGRFGELQVYEDEVLIASKQHWARLSEMGDPNWLQHITERANARVPEEMIPLDDPRLYTHCQWCGKLIDRAAGQRTAWNAGQWHIPDCYEQTFTACRH